MIEGTKGEIAVMYPGRRVERIGDGEEEGPSQVPLNLTLSALSLTAHVICDQKLEIFGDP